MIKEMSGQYSTQPKKWSRNQKRKFQILENHFLREMRASNLPIIGELFKEKTLTLSSKFRDKNFSNSWGWLEKLKARKR